MTNEEYVRVKWARAWVYEGARKLELSLQYPVKFFGTAKEGTAPVWAAAAEFTRERLEQIRTTERDAIQMGDLCSSSYGNVVDMVEFGGEDELLIYYVSDLCSQSRILAGIEARLIELQIGMKP